MKTVKTVLIVFSFMFFTYAQTIATLSSGETIQVFDDGTWKPNPTIEVEEQSISFDSSFEALILTIEDKITGIKLLGSKEPIIVSGDDDKSLVISSLYGNNGVIVSIKVFGAGSCIDKGEKVQILFRDKSRMELHTNTDFNCNSNAIMYFSSTFGKLKEFNILQQREIASMRVWTQDAFVEVNFTEQHSKTFLHTLRHLSTKG